MTTSQEIKDRYAALYGYMAESRDPRNMKIFGGVMTAMMDLLAEKMPSEAEEMVDRLESIKWKQYLTPREAEKITSQMDPKAPWSRETWKAAMEALGLPLEEQPCYNRCALFTEMSKMYSDFGEEIAQLLGKPLSPSDKEIITACYRMAMKTLKDKDGVYDIRRYFMV